MDIRPSPWPRSAKIDLHPRLRASCPALGAKSRSATLRASLAPPSLRPRFALATSAVAPTVSPHLAGPPGPEMPEPSQGRKQAHIVYNRTSIRARRTQREPRGGSKERLFVRPASQLRSWVADFLEATATRRAGLPRFPRLPLPRSSSGHRDTRSRRPAPRRD